MIMNNRLIINLSYQESDIREYFNSDPGISGNILDFTGICNTMAGFGLSIQNAREIDAFHVAEKEAIKSYVQSVGVLSNAKPLAKKSFRNFTINGFPLYWLIPFSIKHPEFHWGYTLFFLERFYKNYPSIFTDFTSFVFILPGNTVFNNKMLSVFLGIPDERKIKCWIFKKKQSNIGALLKAIVRFVYQYSRGYSKIYKSINRSNKSGQFPKNLMLSSYGKTELDIARSNKTLYSIYKFFLSKADAMLLPVPLLAYVKSANEWSCNEFSQSFPTPLQAFSILRQVIKNYIDLSLLNKNKLRKRKQEHVLEPCIVHEMKAILNSINFFFQHQWLINYFKKIPFACRMFYEDEFYEHGRIISDAVVRSGNKNITTYGIQHGIITEHHTVYRICTEELKSSGDYNKDCLPHPDYFLVWGKYFKEQFEEFNNPIMSGRVKVAGSLIHIQTAKKLTNTATKIAPQHPINILWCTTLSTAMRNEYAIMEKYLKEDKQYKLKIRMHPLWNIKEDIIATLAEEILPAIEFDNNKSLEEQAEECDVVVCTGYSTVFVDMVLLRRPTIRVHGTINLPGFLDLEIPGLFNVFTAKEFEDSIQKIPFVNMLEDISTEKLIYLKTDVWDSLIKHHSN